MYMEPGVMEAAKHAGIKKGAMIDADHNMKLDSTDLNIARVNTHQELATGTDAKALKGMATSNVLRTPASTAKVVAY